MFKRGDVVRYDEPSGWTFKVRKVENGRVFSEFLHGHSYSYDPSVLRMVKPGNGMWQVKFYVNGVGVLSKRRFYNREHARGYGREGFKRLKLAHITSIHGAFFGSQEKLCWRSRWIER